MNTGASQLGRLFDEHAARLLLYARQCARTGGAGDTPAEDLVQDAFLRLMNEPTPPENVRAWLYKTVRNAAISQLRSTRRREQRERTRARGQVPWFEPRPENLIDAAAAEQALQQLPDRQREIVVLRIWGQMTLNEVADTVGMPLSSVYDQYKSALATVRAGMKCNRRNIAPMPARTESELL